MKATQFVLISAAVVGIYLYFSNKKHVPAKSKEESKEEEGSGGGGREASSAPPINVENMPRSESAPTNTPTTQQVIAGNLGTAEALPPANVAPIVLPTGTLGLGAVRPTPTGVIQRNPIGNQLGFGGKKSMGFSGKKIFGFANEPIIIGTSKF